MWFLNRQNSLSYHHLWFIISSNLLPPQIWGTIFDILNLSPWIWGAIFKFQGRRKRGIPWPDALPIRISLCTKKLVAVFVCHSNRIASNWMTPISTYLVHSSASSRSAVNSLWWKTNENFISFKQFQLDLKYNTHVRLLRHLPLPRCRKTRKKKRIVNFFFKNSSKQECKNVRQSDEGDCKNIYYYHSANILVYHKAVA